MCANVRKNVDVCVCVCVWWRGGWVGVNTHVHARKPTTVQQVKDIVKRNIHPLFHWRYMKRDDNVHVRC